MFIFYSYNIFYFFACGLVTSFFLWYLVPILSQLHLDQPDARSSHKLPTPRGGGVAFVLVGSIAVALLGSSLPLLCLPLALVGFLDDRHNLPAGLRYGVQLATSLLLLLISPLSALGAGWFSWLLLFDRRHRCYQFH